MPNAAWPDVPGPLVPLVVVGIYLVLAAVALALRIALLGRWRDEETAARGDSALLPMVMRMFFVWALQPLWLLVRWTGLPATGITTLSLLLAIGASVAVATGELALGGWLYLAAGICDVLDGRIARHRGTAGPQGAAIDSVLDRYSDAVLLAGLAWYLRGSWSLPLVLAALVGSLLVPYVRARGEGLGVSVKVGLMQRPERVVLLGAALALAPLLELATDGAILADVVIIAAIAFIAVATQLTAAHRLIHVVRALGRPALQPGGNRYRQLGPALVSASTATAADFALMSLLVARADVSPALATAVGCAVGAALNFSMNRWWTFASRANPLPQAARYAIVSVSSALLNSGGVALTMMLPLPDYRIGWLLVRAVVFLFWNYALQRDYVYGDRGACMPESLDATSDAPPPVSSRTVEG